MVICFAVYRVRRHIEDTIEYCKSKTDNEGGSATCNKMLRNMYPGEDRISCYGLRHGIRKARSYGELKPMNDLAIGIATLMRDAIDAGMDSATSPFLKVWSSWAETSALSRSKAVSR